MYFLTVTFFFCLFGFFFWRGGGGGGGGCVKYLYKSFQVSQEFLLLLKELKLKLEAIIIFSGNLKNRSLINRISH